MKKPTFPVIDAHLHIGFNRSRTRKMARRAGIKYTPQNLLKDLDECGIERAVIMNVPGRERYLENFAKRFPKRFWITGTVSIAEGGKNDFSRLKKGLISGRYVAAKLYTGYEHFHPLDERCAPVYEWCIEAGAPVVFHTGDTVSRDALLKFSHPMAFDELAVKYPKLKIVLAHLGNPWIETAAEIVYKNPNVYADISGLFTGEPCAYKEAIKERLRTKLEDAIYYAGAEKFIFGTDYCLASHREYLNFVLGLNIRQRDLKKILHDNAMRVYGGQ